MALDPVLLRTPVTAKNGLITREWARFQQQLALGPLLASKNLADLTNIPDARTNLGLGTAATHAIAFFLQAAADLSDLPNPATARTNLGLGTAATSSASAFDAAGSAAAAQAASLQKSANLSDLASVSTALSNLGLGGGLSVTVALAKVTGGGADGSLTFTNGILTAKVDPT